MPESELEQLEACREAGLRLLTLRAHSRAELQRKLRSRSFPIAHITPILDDFERVGLLDDRAFSRLYAEERMSSSRPVGRRRVEQELRKRGVGSEEVVEVLGEIWDCGDAEFERALAAGQKKWGTIRDRSDPRKAQAKVIRFLAGRGFAMDVCMRVRDRLEEAATDDG